MYRRRGGDASRRVNSMNRTTRIVEAPDELIRDRTDRTPVPPAVDRYPAAGGELTTLDVGIFDPGGWPSTVPPKATIECRIGGSPARTRGEVRRELIGAVGAVVSKDEWLSTHAPEIERFGWSSNPHHSEHELPRLAERTTDEGCGRSGEWAGGPAGPDERFDVNCYGVPAPSVGPRGGNVHGADEHVEIDSLPEVARVVAPTTIERCRPEWIRALAEGHCRTKPASAVSGPFPSYIPV